MWVKVTEIKCKCLWTGMAVKYGKWVDVDLEYQIKLF